VRILAIDPGEYPGFAIVGGPTKRHAMGIHRCPIEWLGASIPAVKAYLELTGMPDVILIEDQYRGKASQKSMTTLSQRAGYLAGALGLPVDRTYFISPRSWYKAVGAPAKCTKAVCMYRLQHSLTPSELVVLEALVAEFPNQRFDILAALGIAWSYPRLSPSMLKSSRRLLVFEKRTTPRKPRVGRKKGSKNRR